MSEADRVVAMYARNPLDHGEGTEQAPCVKCGTLTRGKGGVCRACKNGYGLPDPKTLTVERIVSYVAACKAELQRRRDELDAALGATEGRAA